jgi:hypothetical protein
MAMGIRASARNRVFLMRKRIDEKRRIMMERTQGGWTAGAISTNERASMAASLSPNSLDIS